ncbi:MAG: phosphate ABC transporter substrate-binding protein, PhoT family [Actinobacteria bacterium]|nr:phosphate ABC transporter substrate-binding protein, PhoT family [Actinomycetota bacterium]
MQFNKKAAVVALAASGLILFSSPAFANQINGSGASFAQPLIDVCKVEFTKDTGFTVNYTAGGSGKGRTDFASNLVDFAASDSAYTSGFPAHLEYAPVYAAPIAIFYNLPTVKEAINLSEATLAQIFSGQITKWNDPQIIEENQGVTIKTPVYKTKKEVVTVGGKKVTKTVPVLDKNGKPTVIRTITKKVDIALPNTPITVYYRTDSSGTSEQFGKFLKGANEGANGGLWPKTASGTFSNMTPNSIASLFNFQGASGSALVAAGVKGKVGGIGYGEVSWATDNKLPTANIKNAAGEFVPPTAAGTSAFLGGGTILANGSVNTDYKKVIPGAYSLGTASYGLVYPASANKNAEKQKIVAAWHTYLLEQCPKKFPEKGYALITGPLYDKAKAQIEKIK